MIEPKAGMGSRRSPVIVAECCGDRKLSKDFNMSSTWVTQTSCPGDCPFFNAGCYAERGRSGIYTSQLNASQSRMKLSLLELALLEAKLIGTLSGKRPLRIHIVGDCQTAEAAHIVSNAADAYRLRRNMPVWTYTHALVPRAAWGTVSVLRSCENMDQIKRAHADNYASAMVVPGPHKSHKSVDLGDGFTGIPCPFQTGKVESCDKCRICFSDRVLHAGKKVILFQPVNKTERKIGAALVGITAQ